MAITKMTFLIYAVTYSFLLFLGLLASLKIGHYMGRGHRPREKEAGEGGALDGVVFALLGLLLAFSFSESLTSYRLHLDLITKEANDIAGAYARLDLLPAESQPELRDLMRQYAESRLRASQAPINSPEEEAALDHSLELQDQLWNKGLAMAKNSGNPAIISQITDSFDNMYNGPVELLAAQRNKIPMIIFILIFILAMMSALVAGYAMSDRPRLNPLRILIFAAAVAMTMYVIIDLEYPRFGFFNADLANRPLTEAIQMMRGDLNKKVPGQ